MLRTIMLAVALIVALPVLAVLVLDTGEVAVLETRGVEGEFYDTQIWVAEIDGVLFVRSGNPQARWAERMRATPQVSLTRDESPESYIAYDVGDAETKARVRREMADKYGLADRIWALTSDRASSAVFRLVPTADDKR